MITLAQLEIGQSARIQSVNGEGQRRQHFLDMGLIPDAIIKLVKFAPLGDPSTATRSPCAKPTPP